MENQQTSKQFLIKKNPGDSAPQSGKEFPLLSDEDIIRQVQMTMNGQAFKKSIASKNGQNKDLNKYN